VALLYEGRQIYFGDIHEAKKFFVKLGFDCPERQTTADFLTSLTSPSERLVRRGFENRTPRTPDEFAAVWQKSEDRARLMREIDDFERQYPVGGPQLEKFRQSRRAVIARNQLSREGDLRIIFSLANRLTRRIKSPYTISMPMQVKLCVRRGFQRLRGDVSLLLTGMIGNTVMALIIGSVFYNLQDNTASLYSRGALLFFGVLLNAFSSALEVGLK
jgi:ATP-binding cassette, subfamily G (WHITE), member 2, PDR